MAHRKYEYDFPTREISALATGGLDRQMLFQAWFNELGQEGWRVLDHGVRVEPTGMVTPDGKDIPKFILEACVFRPIEE